MKAASIVILLSLFFIVKSSPVVDNPKDVTVKIEDVDEFESNVKDFADYLGLSVTVLIIICVALLIALLMLISCICCCCCCK